MTRRGCYDADGWRRQLDEAAQVNIVKGAFERKHTSVKIYNCGLRNECGDIPDADCPVT